MRGSNGKKQLSKIFFFLQQPSRAGERRTPIWLRLAGYSAEAIRKLFEYPANMIASMANVIALYGLVPMMYLIRCCAQSGPYQTEGCLSLTSRHPTLSKSQSIIWTKNWQQQINDFEGLPAQNLPAQLDLWKES